MSTAASISNNKDLPQRYQCANFSVCGVSSSHSPEYIGWRPVGFAVYLCDECGSLVDRLKKDYVRF